MNRREVTTVRIAGCEPALVAQAAAQVGRTDELRLLPHDPQLRTGPDVVDAAVIVQTIATVASLILAMSARRSGKVREASLSAKELFELEEATVIDMEGLSIEVTQTEVTRWRVTFSRENG